LPVLLVFSAPDANGSRTRCAVLLARHNTPAVLTSNREYRRSTVETLVTEEQRAFLWPLGVPKCSDPL
jgi:hypothetical protein